MAYTERCPICYETVSGDVIDHAGHLLSERHRRAYEMATRFSTAIMQLRDEGQCTDEAVDAIIRDLRKPEKR